MATTTTKRCKICKVCLPICDFRMKRCGTYTAGCTQCLAVKAAWGKKQRERIVAEGTFKCQNCGLACSSSAELKTHIKIVHEKIKDHECQSCNFACSVSSDLQRHIKQVHEKIKDHKCPDCEYACTRKGHLNMHIKQVHEKIKDHECPDCNYACSENGTLQRHLLSCNGTGRRMSKGEKRVLEVLLELGFVEDVDFVFDQTFSDLSNSCGKSLRPDFRFLEYKIMIEFDGIQHFKATTFGGCSAEQAEDAFIKTQESDRITNEYCNENGYNMIRISFEQYPEVLSILHGELLDITNWQ
jgi:hypothetical protein